MNRRRDAEGAAGRIVHSWAVSHGLPISGTIFALAVAVGLTMANCSKVLVSSSGDTSWAVCAPELCGWLAVVDGPLAPLSSGIDVPAASRVNPVALAGGTKTSTTEVRSPEPISRVSLVPLLSDIPR